MKILEFDLPAFIMPSGPYWIRDIGLVLLPTNIPVPPSEYYRPKTSTRIILLDLDPMSIKKILTDFVIFSNFLNQNYPLFTWIYERSFTDLSKYLRTINNLDSYVNETSKKQDWYMTVNYDKYPLLEVTPKPSEINFRNFFSKFSKLAMSDPYESKVRRLIDFFAFKYLTGMIMSKIYNNSNLLISNSFIIIESLINMEIKDTSGFETCPHCKEKIPRKKKMIQLIEEYIKTKTEDKETQKTIILILKEHYKIRNNFFHDAKFDSAHEKTNKMIEKLGRNTYSLSDEIEYAGASQIGLSFINSFLRQELLQKLDPDYSST